MNKRILINVICAVIFSFGYYFMIDDVQIGQAIVFGFIYLGLSVIIDFISARIRAKKNNAQTTTVDQELVMSFIETLGGAKNIISTSSESNRLKVVIQDVDLINQEKLKELALDGAYLSGNQLQVKIGPGSNDFSQKIEKLIS